MAAAPVRLTAALVATWLATGLRFATVDGTDPDWDVLVFAQQWPQSFCYGWNLGNVRLEAGDCTLPQNVTSWTIHGLWPSLAGTEGPNFCNDSIPFDESQIAALLDTMRSKWPSLEGPSLEFWTHEWTKHGTCAIMGEPSLFPNQYGYFLHGLSMLNLLPMEKTLGDQGIVPSDTDCYQLSQIKSALSSTFKETPLVLCIIEKSSGTQYLAQVELCLTKQLTLDCTPSAGAFISTSPHVLPETVPCKDDIPVCYPVIQHNTARQV